MPAITKDEVEKALREILAARQEAIVAMKLPDPEDPSQPYKVDPLPGPASPQDIAGVEKAFAVTLPPSFKYLWELHNGVPEFDLSANIFGTKKFTEFNRNKAEKHLSKALDEIERNSTGGLFVFGAQRSNKALFIFDSNKADEFGEWPAINYDTEEGFIDEHESIVGFLASKSESLLRMAQRFRR